jgi:hypothetical protein
MRRSRNRCGRFAASFRKGQLTWCESVELLWQGGGTEGATNALTVHGIDLKRLHRSDIRLLDP